ncbi:MAG TPA: carboxypeptidase regulatory-like domain-containing protein [Gemmatimonadaceae bacterium]|nr:carboxypeptidase regulatory-like domain-containing protein [Gemmatimonadaceae bacterium]
MKCRLLLALAFLSPLPACNTENSDAAVPFKRRAVKDSASGTVALGIEPSRYRPNGAAVNGGAGSIGGTIALRGGVVLQDSVVAVGRDAKLCGDSAVVSEVASNGSTLANALVWVDSIATGKPLPEIRRETLTIERCRFAPRIMAVVRGSTVNVFSRDQVAHSPVFYREGNGQPVDQMHTVDDGQVIPSEKIARQSGFIEARCKLHPFARAYIAVFDHPYFAITDANGQFTIDGLPPGTYNVRVWHERLEKPVVQRVVVGPGGTARLDASLALR